MRWHRLGRLLNLCPVTARRRVEEQTGRRRDEESAVAEPNPKGEAPSALRMRRGMKLRRFQPNLLSDDWSRPRPQDLPLTIALSRGADCSPSLVRVVTERLEQYGAVAGVRDIGPHPSGSSRWEFQAFNPSGEIVSVLYLTHAWSQAGALLADVSNLRPRRVIDLDGHHDAERVWHCVSDWLRAMVPGCAPHSV